MMTRMNIAGCAVCALFLAPSTAFAATVFVPEGSANSVLMVNGATGSTIRLTKMPEA